MDYRDPETARRRSIFHQRIQIGFPGRSFVVDLQSYFSSLLMGGGITGHMPSGGAYGSTSEDSGERTTIMTWGEGASNLDSAQ
ncbi:hypothetical protein DGM85_19650 [Xanthomonas phaseoli pv. phaseoli]|uniref:Uncharacterized protein n=1 Tax=Xanthomonas campestris pv. phaseoli TaxID=317013 RepID=A0AB38E1A2_XANCH|nr:hypothetical protein DGM93_19340 [Xanthomonas phaseoli pv. phaseoli]QWN30367.1 hypothetical protein DGM85_19650 [Xanthomonas phaseoli pv. phaseoli]QWN34478.1 hypothetical protein DGM81_19100 [Xanthomonas phaseoli pv. phaseoli]SON82788.1 hypothetical protein XAP6984_480008 [Xanthomonas phaseoli pv. phaseoli]SON90151.1 hypothetical protein XAP7430_450010 [Xanthomonas phaseoli pv. phaseoli]